jgi:E3 ubiquitin-protein ligase HUWE1
VELVPGGRDIRVTETKKRVYVDLIAAHRMTTSIKHQIKALLEGFWELVPKCVRLRACVAACQCVERKREWNGLEVWQRLGSAHISLPSAPRHLISIFNDHELELLISGLPDIDTADLRAHTE